MYKLSSWNYPKRSLSDLIVALRRSRSNLFTEMKLCVVCPPTSWSVISTQLLPDPHQHVNFNEKSFEFCAVTYLALLRTFRELQLLFRTPFRNARLYNTFLYIQPTILYFHFILVQLPSSLVAVFQNPSKPVHLYLETSSVVDKGTLFPLKPTLPLEFPCSSMAALFPLGWGTTYVPIVFQALTDRIRKCMAIW